MSGLPVTLRCILVGNEIGYYYIKPAKIDDPTGGAIPRDHFAPPAVSFYDATSTSASQLPMKPIHLSSSTRIGNFFRAESNWKYDGLYGFCLGVQRPTGVASPLIELQSAQAETMFSQVNPPPFDSGCTWSIVTDESVSGFSQY